MSTLLDPTTVRQLAAELSLRPSKQRGQNFVIDANTVRRIVAHADVQPGQRVLEVGPGLGSLTLGLLEADADVIAVEIDDRLAARLPRTIAERAGADAPFTVVADDALRITELPGTPPTALVANLPYNVAVPVILHLWNLLPSLTSGLVMVQSEVADRLAATPGGRVYGVPSAKMAWNAEARRVGTIGRKVFWPEPHVDSALVALTRRQPPTTTATRAHVWTIIDLAFSQRRKMLRSVLAPLGDGPGSIEAALVAAGVDPQARGETLDIDAFIRIAEQLAA